MYRIGVSEMWVDQLDAGTGLMHLATLVQGIFAEVSERHELTPVQARLLCVLIGGPRGMAELAQLFGVEKAALTGLMDRIEKRGLAQRSAVPGDRRALQVMLTDDGRRAAIAFHSAMGEAMTQLTDSIPTADREQFRSTIAGIVTRCRTSPSSE
jgi:DNA-binding MarR family transcriptional regulator